MTNESHVPTDQAAPISTDDLRELLDAATPGPWELCAHLRLPNENGCTCGYRGVVYGRGDYAICQPGHDVTPGEECLDPARLPRDEEIANMRLVAIVPQLAAEVLSRRADLAAPSAPPEPDPDCPNCLGDGYDAPSFGCCACAATSAPEPQGEWLIHKAGRGWYRPNAQGYTSNPAEAGRYSHDEALSYSHPNGWDGPRDEITIKTVSEVLGSAPSAPAEVDDGRPMNTDVFLGKLFEACEDHWDRCEAINEWLRDDWPAALEYLEGEA